MRRSLAMALGAVMAVGSAAPVCAAGHIDFSGYYRIMYMNEVNTGLTREPRSFTDSYFQDRLQLDFSFRPTDEISVHWRLRGPGSYQRWGGGGKNLYTEFIYGEIKQDWGAVLVGRLSDDLDVYGLASLGYQPATVPIYTNVGPFDRADITDGFRYAHDWGNGFSLMAQYSKLGNNDQFGGQAHDSAVAGADLNDHNDQDHDRYQVEVAYAWDGGGLALQLFYDRNASDDGRFDTYSWGFKNDYANYAYPGDFPSYTSPGPNKYGASFRQGRLNRVNKIDTWGLNPAFRHSWGSFSVNFEGLATWGVTQFRVQPQNTGPWQTYDQHGEGYGAYLDFGYNYGPGNVTLAGWWVSGTDLDQNPDDLRARSNSIADLVGGNFYPLLVAYNGLNLNPGGNRHRENNGQGLSAIAFANNGYENYVYQGHVGRLVNNTTIQTGPGSPTFEPNKINYMSLNGIELNTGSSSWENVDNLYVQTYGTFAEQVLGAAHNSDRTRTTSFNNDTDANHWAIALTGSHAFTDDISMHYGLAYLRLNKPNYRIAKGAVYTNLDPGNDPGNWAVTGYTSQEKDLGFEIDLGLTIQLLDNLSFTSAFGYMFNGDAYKSMKGYTVVNPIAGQTIIRDGQSIKAVWADADDSYVWFNSLTFTF